MNGDFPMRRLSFLATLLALVVTPAAVSGHAPSVIDSATDSPAEAIVLEDPTLSRAIGAIIEQPGEVDWYRLDLESGDPLVVGMTAPDATGAVAATFTLLGPGLPGAADSGPEALALAEAVGVDGAIVFTPAAEPRREVHGGLGFINYGTIRTEAPESGSYYVAVYSVDPEATGKYVFAPGQREEFGLDAIGGMLDLIGFFSTPWPSEPTD
jgi:hypothetical protein